MKISTARYVAQAALVALALCSTTLCFSQPGTLDPTFGTNGIWEETETYDPRGTSVYDGLGIQPTGKLIVMDANRFGRFHANGTPDLAFGTNGWAYAGASTPLGMALQHDGKIVSIVRDNVQRHNADGTRDFTFGTEGYTAVEVFGYNVVLLHVVVDNKNRIVVAGRASVGQSPDQINTLVFARLNPDGSFDTTMGNGGIRLQTYPSDVWHSPIGCGVDLNYKIYFGIERGGIHDEDDFITCFNENGTLDTQFGNGGIVETYRDLEQIAVSKQGRVAYVTRQAGIVGNRIPPLAGYADRTAGNVVLGSMNVDRLSAVVYQDDGKVIITGCNNIGGGIRGLYVRRYTADGLIDNTFSGSEPHVYTNFGKFMRATTLIYHNRSLYVAGRNINFEAPQIQYYDHTGILMKYDASIARMTCPTPQSQYGADPGECYATVTDINASFNTGTLWANMKHKMEYNGVVTQGDGSLSGRQFLPGTTHVTYTYTDVTTQTCTFDVVVADKRAPQLTCPAAIILNTDQWQCYATLDIRALGTAKVEQDCGPVTVTCPTMPPGNKFPIGVTALTWTATDEAGNISTCIQLVTVVDSEAPTIAIGPWMVSTDPGQCYATIPLAQLGQPAAFDNCSNVTITPPDMPAANIFPKGDTDLLWRVTDGSGNTATTTQRVTVVDAEAPVIANLTATPNTITQPNGKMRDIAISYTTTDNCTVKYAAITGITCNEPIGRADVQVVNANLVRVRADRSPKGNGRIYTITVECIDASGNTTQRTVTISVPKGGKTNIAARIATDEIWTNADDAVNLFIVDVYPNPGTAAFVIEMRGAETSPATISVINTSGAEVETITTTGNSVRIGDTWQPGVYVLQVLRGTSRKVMKVIKQ